MGTDHQSSLSQDLPRSRPINPSSRWITNWFVSSPLLAQPSQESLGKWTRDRQRPVLPHALTSVPQPVLQYAVFQLLHHHHHHHQAHQEPQDHSEDQDQLDQEDHQDPQDHQDQEDHQDPQDHQEPQLDQLDHQEVPDQVDHQDHQDHHDHAQLSALHNVSHHAQPTVAHRRSTSRLLLDKNYVERRYQPIEWKELQRIEDRSTIVTRDCYRLYCCIVINYFYTNLITYIMMTVINMIER